MEKDNDVKTLWMGEVEYYMTEEWLEQLFLSMGCYGIRVKVPRDRATQEVMGYGFVEFNSREEAMQVLESYAGREIPNTGGKLFRLNWASYGVRDGGPSGGNNEHHAVYVGDLGMEVTDTMLFDAFARTYRTVDSAKVVSDGYGRPRGYGFVRFRDAAEAGRAIREAQGMILAGRAIRVREATPKRTTAAAAVAAIEQKESVDPENTSIFVGGLMDDITENDLREALSQCGDIESVRIMHQRGFGFVHFYTHEDAEQAISQMNGQSIRGCRVRINWGKGGSRQSSGSNTAAQSASAQLLQQQQQQEQQEQQQQQWAAYYAQYAQWYAQQMVLAEKMREEEERRRKEMAVAEGKERMLGRSTCVWEGEDPEEPDM